jgi:zinc/manganese transport system permease protein
MALTFLFYPLLACLVLAGIHAYLGLHVVEREVIFVDLSLAQVAALGTTIAFLAGFDLHSTAAYVFSLAFALLGAAVFSWTREGGSHIPQEAVIGIVYAVAAGAAILIVDRSPEGAEHIKYILVGNLLAVTPGDVLKIAILYGIVGLTHWWARKPLLLVSTDPDGARRAGLSVRWWDFLFYGTFALVVTSSVAIAGVLLVFSFLIVPAVTAMLFARSVTRRLVIGWAMGGGVAVLGIWLSYLLDTPTGATVVCTFGGVLAVLAAARGLKRRLA